jgi:N-acetylglutamate synthase-like GNAT family acetyltransferase
MGLGQWLSALIGRGGRRSGNVVLMPVRTSLAQAEARLVAHPLALGERGPMAAALARSQLPYDDIDAPGRLFWRFDTVDDVPVGFGGIEICGEAALLRSIVTLPPLRTRGIGSAIVQALEAEAALHGCRECYLLTMTEAGFFEKLGYVQCDPASVPAAVRDTRLFATRPSSVDALVKRL